jgi:hypothetical protein
MLVHMRKLSGGALCEAQHARAFVVVASARAERVTCARCRALLGAGGSDDVGVSRGAMMARVEMPSFTR